MVETVLLQHVLLAVFRNHLGRDRGIPARDLVIEVNAESVKLLGPAVERCTERGLRTVVNELRLQGHHICAHPSDGYFLAQTPEELLATTDFLESRAMNSLAQAAAMKRVSLQDLFGQLHLPT